MAGRAQAPRRSSRASPGRHFDRHIRKAPEAPGYGNFAWDRASERHFNYFDAISRRMSSRPYPTFREPAPTREHRSCWPLTQGKSSIRWNIPGSTTKSLRHGTSKPLRGARLARLRRGGYAEWSVDHEGKLQDRLTCDIIKPSWRKRRAARARHYLLVHSIPSLPLGRDPRRDRTSTTSRRDVEA